MASARQARAKLGGSTKEDSNHAQPKSQAAPVRANDTQAFGHEGQGRLVRVEPQGTADGGGVYGHASASTETPADWSANTGFLMGLLVALTTRARLGVINQDPTLKSAVVPQGVVELIHYVSENLQWRLANPESPKTWSLDDCLTDYVEAAEFYGLQDFLDDALGMAGK